MRQQLILEIVMAILIMNCATFTLARLILQLSGECAASLEIDPDITPYSSGDVGTMTYLVAGNLNQPAAAFQFLKPELSWCTQNVNYRMIGWNAKSTARQIADEICAMMPKKAMVYTISLGDHVARYVEEYLRGSLELLGIDLEIIAINPCTTVDFMIPPLGALLKIGAPVFEVACHALGWLSVIPVIPTVGGRCSLILLADQYWTIAYDRPPHETSHTIGVICSKPDEEKDQDGLLDNGQIRSYFGQQGEPIFVTIKTSHGNTVGAAEAYRDGIEMASVWRKNA